MRTMIAAFACIVAVACGTALTSFKLAWALPGLLALTVAVALFARFLASSRTDEHPPMASWAVGLLVCLGLLRGASVEPAAAPRVGERGVPDAMLRSFEVIGASEPGPRCRFEVDGGNAALRVSAPIEACPLAAGDEVAILAAALRPHWSAFVRDGPAEIDLGRGPVVWRRQAAASSWLDRYWQWVADRRQQAWDSSRGDATASLVFAAGLGLRSALEPERRDDLRAAGLGHLIAVSGLHIAVAALWLQFVARRLAALFGVSPTWAGAIAWLPLWAYVGLTGAAASAVRAAMMLTFVDLGTIVGRPVHPTTSLTVTAAAMLLWQPQWLLDPGFMLSLAAMAAIVTAPPDLGVLATSWRITWATAPLSVWLFDAAPLHGLLANVVALPLFGLMMPAALIASVSAGPLATWALATARLFAAPILDLAAWLAALPSVGPAALLAISCVALALHARRGDPRPSEHEPRWRTWLPPKLACALAMAISCVLCVEAKAARVGASPASAPRFDWIAVGSVRSRALLVADAKRPGHACLFRPTSSSVTWTWLLDTHDITHLDRIDAALPRPDRQVQRSDPRTRALAQALTRAGVEIGESGDSCQPPPPEQVRALLRACRFLSPRGPALARWWAGAGSCRIEDRWVIVVAQSST